MLISNPFNAIALAASKAVTFASYDLEASIKFVISVTVFTFGYIVNYILKGTIKMLAPIMPFISDELWSIFNNTTESIVNSSFPVYDDKLVFANEANQMAVVQEIVSKIRNVRSEMNISPAAFITTKIKVLDEKGSLEEIIQRNDAKYKILSTPRGAISSFENASADDTQISVYGIAGNNGDITIDFENEVNKIARPSCLKNKKDAYALNLCTRRLPNTRRRCVFYCIRSKNMVFI